MKSSLSGLISSDCSVFFSLFLSLTPLFNGVFCDIFPYCNYN